MSVLDLTMSFHRLAVNSLQRAGGIYSLVSLSPSVGCYQGGTFSSNVPLRVIQPALHQTTGVPNCTEMPTEENLFYGIKVEEKISLRKRQASLPCVRMSYEVKEGASQRQLRVTVCWREVLYKDDAAGQWVKANLIF